MQNNFAQLNNAQSNFAQSISREDIYAGFFTRLAAYLIDALFLFVCLAVPRFIFWIIDLSSPDNFLTRDILFSFSLWNIVEYLLCTAYFVFLTYTSGMTLGKKAMRIKVIAKDGGKLSLFAILYRETIGKYLSALVLYIGYLLIGIDKEKRGFHDMLADTLVIYTCKVVEYKQQQTFTPIQHFTSVQPQGSNPVQPQNGSPMQLNSYYQVPPQSVNPVQPNNYYQSPPQDVNPVQPQNGQPGQQSFFENTAEAAKDNTTDGNM